MAIRQVAKLALTNHLWDSWLSHHRFNLKTNLEVVIQFEFEYLLELPQAILRTLKNPSWKHALVIAASCGTSRGLGSESV